MFFSYYYFFFFFYSCTVATTITTITIISNNVNEGEKTPKKTHFLLLVQVQFVKFWVLELQKEEGASSSKACFIANFRSWEHVHTHTHTRFDYSTRFASCDATPHTFVFFVHGF
jgi:hypothetical protein